MPAEAHPRRQRTEGERRRARFSHRLPDALPDDGRQPRRPWRSPRARRHGVPCGGPRRAGRLAPRRILHLAVAWLPRPRGCSPTWCRASGPGDRYRLEIEGRGVFPDPASRYQPQGVHGPSEVIDPRFDWSDEGWRGPDPADLAIYELHVGTFTPQGTFSAARERLPALVELGVTIVELMPLADFPGERNWGYDPAALFAPARCYGRPEALRAFVNEAHRLGLGVLLDVVYNHLGPDGAYLPAFLPDFLFLGNEPVGTGRQPRRSRQRVGAGLLPRARGHVGAGVPSRWPAAGCDAHAAGRERASPGGRGGGTGEGGRRNAGSPGDRHCRGRAQPGSGGAAGQARAAGGSTACGPTTSTTTCAGRLPATLSGYYRDFSGTTRDIADTIRRGWFFTGQHSEHEGGARGTDPHGIPPHRFVFCIQNHDQVGNRALGSRLNADVDLPTYLAATVLLLAAPETPLLFMGQEWAATSPFLYFTDHEPGAGTEGDRGPAPGVPGVPGVRRRGEPVADPRPAGGLDVRGEPVELGGGVARTARRRQAVAPGAAGASPAGCAACASRGMLTRAGARRGHRGDFQGGDGNTGRHDRSHPAPGQRERAAWMAWKAVAGDPGHHGRSGVPAGLARDRDRERSHCPDDYVRPIRRRDSGLVTRSVFGTADAPVGNGLQ